MTAGHSVTVGIVLVAKLVARAREGDAEAVNRVCDLVTAAVEQPDRRVGAAFGLKPRGGRPLSLKDRFQERNSAFCELVELQADRSVVTARQKLARYAANGWPHEQGMPDDTGNPERDSMRKILRTGLSVPRLRQCWAIAAGKAKNRVQCHSPV